MRKLSLIGINSYTLSSFTNVSIRCVHLAIAAWLLTTLAFAQDEEPKQSADADTAPAEVQYPRAVAVDGDRLLVVDLDLPGIWQVTGETRELWVRGTKLLRKPLNRPWCVSPHPAGGILVGDSATREVYAIAAKDAQPQALTDGHIGIPMALAVAADKKTIYVGDAEKRAVFRIPIEGGSPELVVRVNARALSFDPEGNLWAVTPDDAAVVRIDVKANQAETVIDGRPYEFPNGLTWAGDRGYVTDTYGKSIWTFTADGKTEKWLESDELRKPLGIAANEQSVFVADADRKQVLEINRESKAVTPRM
jgi:sugar lactone lactonase YvrE